MMLKYFLENMYANMINSDLVSIDSWSDDWMVTFNAQKTDAMLISRKRDPVHHPPLIFQDHQLEHVDQRMHLGPVFRNDLRWNDHINTIVAKASKQLNILKTLQFLTQLPPLQTFQLKSSTRKSLYTPFLATTLTVPMK